MQPTFDDHQWERLQEELNVAQLCGENAGKVYAYAKGAMQRAVAAIAGEKEVTAEEAEHCRQLLGALRHGAEDAAGRYATAVAAIDRLLKALEPPASRARRRA
jgi:hypothetical protein